MDSYRILSVDSELNLPDKVREKQAENLKTTETPEGAAVADTIEHRIDESIESRGILTGHFSVEETTVDSAWRQTTDSGHLLPLGYDSKGHLDTFARKIWKEDINNVVEIPEHPFYAKVIVTENGEILSALRWDGTWYFPNADGAITPPPPVTPPTTIIAPKEKFYLDAPYNPGSDIMPIHANLKRIAGWGSSSMGGLASQAQAMATSLGATFYSGGQGGEKSYHIAARLGSIPARISFSNNSIPASGAIAVSSSNINSPASLRTYRGHFVVESGEKVFGTLSNSSNALTFTRDGSGTAQTIQPDSKFIPDHGVNERDSVTLLWMGKNNISETQRVIDETNASFEYLAPLAKKCIVLGHFVNTTTPAVSTSRDQIYRINADHEARFGQAYIEVNRYLISDQLWVDTGITPTDQDLAEQALGNKPPSVSSDNGHLNGAGYAAVRKLIETRIEALGWYK